MTTRETHCRRQSTARAWHPAHVLSHICQLQTWSHNVQMKGAHEACQPTAGLISTEVNDHPDNLEAMFGHYFEFIY